MAGFHISLLLFNILKQTGIEALKTDKAYILTKKKKKNKNSINRKFTILTVRERYLPHYSVILEGLIKKEKLSHNEQNKNTQRFQKPYGIFCNFISFQMEKFYYFICKESCL